MAEIEGKGVEQDLQYVRGVMARSERGATPRGIYFLWAAITLVGFTLIDVAPEVVGFYWMVASPLGWLISGYLAWQHAKASGQDDRHIGQLHAWHWLVAIVSVGLAALLPAQGLVPWPVMGSLSLLIISVAYLLAALHLDRRLIWPALLMVAGYVLLVLDPAFSWTLVGVAVSAGLALSGLLGGPLRGTHGT